jgi:glucose-1-phosphate cytidylyltransferase
MGNITAILLCGGKGERLRPFTESFPKPLVPLNGRPLLYYLMKYLADEGVNRFIVCVGYKADAIEHFVSTECPPEWEVTCVDSGEASMTERLRDAQRFINGPSLICYGDTLANVDLRALRREHQSAGALATMTVYPLHSPFGIISFDERNRITKFLEKPQLPYWINIGYLLCDPAAFRHLNPQADMPEFLSSLAEANAISAYQHRGKHLTVNDEKERAKAESEVIEFFTLMDEQKI